MPLLKGWATDDRRLLLHLIHAIGAQEERDRRDRIALDPELARARTDMLAYIRRGSTGTTGNVSTQSAELAEPGSAELLVNLGVSATAEALGISESYARRLCRNGKLISKKVRGVWLIDKVDVERQKERT